VPYVSGQPQGGLTSVRQVRQAYMSHFIEPSGSFPSAWPGPVGQRAVLGNYGGVWAMFQPVVISSLGSTGIRAFLGK